MRRIALIFIMLGLCRLAGAQETVTFTLDECRSLALDNNTDVKNAKLNEVSAKAKKNEIFTNWFPQVSMTGFAYHSFDYQIKMSVSDIFGKNSFGYNLQALWTELAPELGTSSTFNYFKYGQAYNVMAVQPVFMGGQIYNGNKYAALGIEAAQLKGSITRREVLEEVDKAYFQVTALMEKKRTLDALQALLDSLESVADIAFRQGVILKADHMLLQTKKLELQKGKIKLRSGMKLLKMNLLSTIGIDYSVLDIDKYEFLGAEMENVPSPEQVYVDEEKVAAETEESKLLDLLVKSKEYEKKITFGSTLPQLGVGVTYGWKKMIEGNSGRFNGMTFAVVRIPISDWAKNSYKMQQQQVEIDKAVNDRNHLKEMLVLQQRKLFLELTSAWDAFELARSQKEYTEYLYEQARLSYEAGFITVTDLMQSYASLSEVQENYCSAISEYLMALQSYKSRLP